MGASVESTRVRLASGRRYRNKKPTSDALPPGGVLTPRGREVLQLLAGQEQQRNGFRAGDQRDDGGSASVQHPAQAGRTFGRGACALCRPPQNDHPSALGLGHQ